MKTSTIFSRVVPCLALAVTATARAQRTIISDDFSSVTVIGAPHASQSLSSGYNTYSSLSQNGNYTNSTNGALTFSGTNNALGYIAFQSVTLANTGDYLQVSFDLAYATRPIPSATAPLRFGLYNMFGDPHTTKGYHATANPVGDTAAGYSVSTNPAATGAAWTPGSASIAKDVSNGATLSTSNAINGGTGIKTLTSQARTAAYSAGVPQKVTLRITRTGATSSIIAWTFAGETFTATDVGDALTTFDIFSFSNGAGNPEWSMDNLLVSAHIAFAVPEPSTYASFTGSTPPDSPSLVPDVNKLQSR